MKLIGVCRDCSFYEKGWWSHKPAPDGGLDSYIDPSIEGSFCRNPLVSSDCLDEWENRDATDECPENGAYAGCDENRGYLNIGPLFGCIHWTARVAWLGKL